MSNLDKVNLLLEKIDSMKEKIQQTINNPFLPEEVKIRKIRDMESTLKDSQAFALIFMSAILEEEVAVTPADETPTSTEQAS